jgi:hypothetical protein
MKGHVEIWHGVWISLDLSTATWITPAELPTVSTIRRLFFKFIYNPQPIVLGLIKSALLKLKSPKNRALLNFI